MSDRFLKMVTLDGWFKCERDLGARDLCNVVARFMSDGAEKRMFVVHMKDNEIDLMIVGKSEWSLISVTNPPRVHLEGCVDCTAKSQTPMLPNDEIANLWNKHYRGATELTDLLPKVESFYMRYFAEPRKGSVETFAPRY